MSLLVIDKDTPGFTVTRKLDKMGWRSSDTAELSYTDVRVPAANVVGVENSGFLGYAGGETRSGPVFTGDLGEIDADGFLRISGRKLNTIITAHGRNVAPEWVESELTAQPEIRQAVVLGEAQAELQCMLKEVEARYAALGDTYNGDKLDELYQIANRAIGVAGVAGREAVDVALVSLCQLLDYLKTAGRWDNASVEVHVQALRLLLAADPNDQQVAAILDGLKRVSALYAAPTAAEG